MGRSWVDGVDHGQVLSGQHVEVTRTAVVLIDGVPREPEAVQGETTQSTGATDR